MNLPALLQKRNIPFLSEISLFLFGINFWLFYTLVLVLALIQNGIWYSPQTERLLLISQDIFKNPFLEQPANQWLVSSFLGPVIGYITKMNQSVFSYSLMHLVIFLIIFPCLIFFIRRKYQDFAARSILIIFFLSPVSNVLFTWLGSPDILTFILLVLVAAFWKNLAVLFLGSFFLAINHPEQGLVILILLSVFIFLTQEKQAAVRFALVGFGALFLGKTLMQWYFRAHDFALAFSRFDYIPNAGLFRYIKATFSNPFALIFSLFHLLIIFLIAYISFFQKKNRISLAFIVYSLLSFGVILVTLDQTRVFSILTFPALLILVLSPSYSDLDGAEKDYFQNILALSFLAGVLIPRFIVWEGNIYFSAYQNILILLHDLM